MRICDEITVDLMKSASGMEFPDIAEDACNQIVDGVPIPFDSPRLLWLMKRKTYREKDQGDLVLLRQQYPEATVD